MKSESDEIKVLTCPEYEVTNDWCILSPNIIYIIKVYVF